MGTFDSLYLGEFPLSLLLIIFKYSVPAFKNNIIVGCQLRANNRNRTYKLSSEIVFPLNYIGICAFFLTSSHSWKEAQCTNLFFRHPLLFSGGCSRPTKQTIYSPRQSSVVFFNPRIQK